VAEAAKALADLTEISRQIEAAVIFDREGTVIAGTVDDERAGRLASAAAELFRAAGEQRAGELVQLDATLQGGTVFVVRDADRLIAATTGQEPTVGRVFYDLKTCLRALGEPEAAAAKPKPKPKPQPRGKAEPKAKPKPRKAPAKRGTTTRKKKDAGS
jgi:predicted regulator of Ras-like GTPase activity (Roadblock/LC7/MglB family)